MNWKTWEEMENDLGIYYRPTNRKLDRRKGPIEEGQINFKITIPSTLKRKMKHDADKNLNEELIENSDKQQNTEEQSHSMDQIFSSTQIGASVSHNVEDLHSVKRPRLSPIVAKSKTALQSTSVINNPSDEESDSVFDNSKSKADVSHKSIPIHVDENQAQSSVHLDMENSVQSGKSFDNSENASNGFDLPATTSKPTKSTQQNESEMFLISESATLNESYHQVLSKAKHFLGKFKPKKIPLKVNNNQTKTSKTDKPRKIKPPKGFDGFAVVPPINPASSTARHRTTSNEVNRISSNLAQWRYTLEQRLLSQSSDS
ncbi:uncharacterized protein LOC144745918 [Ciona intestinalis]